MISTMLTFAEGVLTTVAFVGVMFAAVDLLTAVLAYTEGKQ